MTSTLPSCSLFYRDGSSDKEYNAIVEESGNGYVVNFSYGRRGNATATGTKTSSPVSLDDATKIYNKLVQEKTAKGYQPDASAAPFAGISAVSDKVSTGLIPQLLNPITEAEMERYIKDDNYLAQEKLDGKRIMATSEIDGVVTSNRKGLTCGVPKEIERGVSVFRGTILDGEMIGDRYHVFDLLRLGGVDWRNESCLARFKMLEAMMQKLNPHRLVLVRCAETEADKRALVESLRHKEGVVFKLKSSRYVPGRPNSGGNQFKCKFWSDVSVQVIKVNDKASVQVAISDKGKLIPVGNVTTNGHVQPSVGDIVDVTYLYAYKGGSLYQPKYKCVRTDHDVDDISVLKYKSEDTED